MSKKQNGPRLDIAKPVRSAQHAGPGGRCVVCQTRAPVTVQALLPQGQVHQPLRVAISLSATRHKGGALLCLQRGGKTVHSVICLTRRLVSTCYASCLVMV